jgi:hypothetical protein
VTRSKQTLSGAVKRDQLLQATSDLQAALVEVSRREQDVSRQAALQAAREAVLQQREGELQQSEQVISIQGIAIDYLR